MDISEDFQIVNFFIFFFAAATLALRVFFVVRNCASLAFAKFRKLISLPKCVIPRKSLRIRQEHKTL